MQSKRIVIEGPQEVGADEEIPFTVDISNWGSNPTDITVTLYDEDDADVTSTNMTGSASTPTTTTILLPYVHSLTAGKDYRIKVVFKIGSRARSAWIPLYAKE